MNYYPYLNSIPYAAAPTKTGLLKSLFGGIKWSSIINGTQKTLGIVNQAIPLIKQAGPVINNAKTMFKVMNEFKKPDINIEEKVADNIVENINSKNISTENVNKNIKTTINNGPVFFQ